MLRELMVGAWPMVPDIRINVVDVRDVALAHVHAIANPRASGRYILAHADVSFQDLCAIVRDAYPHAKVPRFRAPPPQPPRSGCGGIASGILYRRFRSDSKVPGTCSLSQI